MFDAALAFLARAFGLEPVVFDAASTEIRFAAVRHGSGMVMVQPQLPSERHGSHAGRGWVYVAVDDPDEHHRRAEAAAPSCWARRTTAWADASAATAHAIRRATSGASEPPTRRKRLAADDQRGALSPIAQRLIETKTYLALATTDATTRPRIALSYTTPDQHDFL
jgi:hypothetical protein